MSFAWFVIYLNFPLWIAIGILAFAFRQWDIVRFILYGNIALLLVAFLRHSHQVRLREETLEELKKYKKEGQSWNGAIKEILGKLRRGKRKEDKSGAGKGRDGWGATEKFRGKPSDRVSRTGCYLQVEKKGNTMETRGFIHSFS